LKRLKNIDKFIKKVFYLREYGKYPIRNDKKLSRFLAIDEVNFTDKK